MSLDVVDWCRRNYGERYRRLRILPTADGNHALWLDDGRVRAVIGRELPSTDDFKTLHLCLVLASHQGQWHLGADGNWSPIGEEEALDLLDAADVEPDETLRRVIVDAIRADHAQQLRGSLAAGFIKRLDQQFPRAELYLFELLQNAVDEGAQLVSFEVRDHTLVFQHDGAAFNASDILGLSAVGASGKSGRTIGFMGLGFKAVYTRFDRVELSDGSWKVRYERPGDSRDGGWKFLPEWTEETASPEGGFRCRFDFSRPKGSETALIDDLTKLDPVVPVLLARRAIRRAGDTWELRWNQRLIRVRRNADGPSGAESFSLTDSGQEPRRWFFLGTRWFPSAEAVESWRNFRDDPDGDPGEQELALFAELDREGNLVCGSVDGILHAVLPTAQILPLGFHLQANWLLQADRQGAMSARDNAWNAEVIRQLPFLVIRLLQWIADGNGPPEIEEPYRRLPLVRLIDGQPVLAILDIDVDFSPVSDALMMLPIVPIVTTPAIAEVLASKDLSDLAPVEERALARQLVNVPENGTYEFVHAPVCRLIPNRLLSEIGAGFIDAWLGNVHPFAFETTEPAGDFFRAFECIGEISSDEWEGSAENLSKILQAMPSDRVRVWVTIHLLASTLRSLGDNPSPPNDLAVLPDGRWQPRSLDTLTAPPRQYFQLDETARQALAPDTEGAPALLLLQVLITPQTGNEIDDGNARAVAEFLWPKGGDGRLKDVTAPFFKRLAAAEGVWDTQASEFAEKVVSVTRSIRRLQTANDAVTHVLGRHNGALRLLPRDEVWVGAAYGFPHIEQAGNGDIPLVAGGYGDEPEWCSFFASICRTHPKPEWQIVDQCAVESQKVFEYSSQSLSKARTDVRLPLPFGLGSGHRDEVHVLCTRLRPWREVIEKGGLDLVRARALCTVLGQGNFSPVTVDGKALSSTGVYITWIPRQYQRDFQVSQKRIPSWVATLRDCAWVPTNDGRVVPPRDVLLRLDPHNPDAPVADLDESTRQGLEPLAEAVKFGKSVPKPGPLNSLLRAGQRTETTDATLITLWEDVLADEELDVGELRTNARQFELIPVRSVRRDGKSRVTSRRLVKVGNRDFGSFLAAVADTALADHRDRLVALLQVPHEPTPEQAMDYLEWVWSEEPSEVDEAVISAWKVLTSEPHISPLLEQAVRSERTKLFCRQPGARRGEWLPLPSPEPKEAVWNDDPGKAACLLPSDGVWLEAWMSRRVGESELSRLPELLSIDRLSSSRFRLDVRTHETSEKTAETDRLARLVAAMQATYETERPSFSKLEVRAALSIERTFRIGDAEPRVEQLDVTWKPPGVLYVVGDSAAVWAADLRMVVQQALGVGANARALRFLDLLSLLDDERNFDRKFQQVCRELEVWPDNAGNPDTEPSPSDHMEAGPTGEPDEGTGEEMAFESKGAEESEAEGKGHRGEGHTASDGSGNAGKSADSGSDGATRGSGGHRSSAESRGTNTGGGSKSPRPHTGNYQAPNRFLMESAETEEDGNAERERRLPKDDDKARCVVMDYERRQGRSPTEADRYQAGFDVSSVDPDGAERKIEIKGLEGEWQGDASVSMTGRQLDDARYEDGDWWLYVVEKLGTDTPNVITLQNPAKGARAFYLYARHWRAKAKPEPIRKPPTADQDEDV